MSDDTKKPEHRYKLGEKNAQGLAAIPYKNEPYKFPPQVPRKAAAKKKANKAATKQGSK